MEQHDKNPSYLIDYIADNENRVETKYLYGIAKMLETFEYAIEIVTDAADDQTLYAIQEGIKMVMKRASTARASGIKYRDA